MSIYFFHMTGGAVALKDPQGKELPDLVAARAYAIDSAREIVSELVRLGKVIDGTIIEICDQSGAVLDRVSLRDVVRF